MIERNINDDIDTLNEKLSNIKSLNQKSSKVPVYKLSECSHNHENLWLLKPTGFN